MVTVKLGGCAADVRAIMHALDDSFELAALRLHLAVGMASADGEVHAKERGELEEFVAGIAVTPAQRAQLSDMLTALLVTPPPLDALLRSLVDRITNPQLAQLLIDDLMRIARVDSHVDPREEALLRMVCGALEVDPVSLFDDHVRSASDASAADLARLVRDMLGLELA
jgi:tellurite resistance protein